jgi:nitrite reductase (NO-forming)
MSVEERRGRRVIASHAIARSAFRAAALFAVVAVGWSIWVLWQGGSWWGPLHAFVAGTVLMAISGATQMFTITWAAAPPPARGLANGQRWSLVLGVGLVLIGMGQAQVWAVIGGVILVVIGLALLAFSLWSAVRRSLLRRFDLSARFYLLALSAGTVGVVLGAVLGTGSAGTGYEDLRMVHSHPNLVGLVGLTIVGTLPTILPTFAHHRAVSGAEARVAWWLSLVAVVSIASGMLLGAPAAGAGTIMAGFSLALILAGVVGRLRRRGLEGGLPYLQVGLGSIWLAVWAGVDGIGLLAGSIPAHFSASTAAVVTAGVGQVVLGSLAYLLPVLAGPPPRLGRNLARTLAYPWLPLALANFGGMAFIAGMPLLGVAAVAVWLGDFVGRLLRMEWGSRDEGGVDDVAEPDQGPPRQPPAR